MNILSQIVEHKRAEVAAKKLSVSISDFQSMELFGRKTHSLRTSIKKAAHFAVIAEIKRGSPSAGTIRENVSPEKIAVAYEENGAAGISVLTDEKFFSGSVNDLSLVRRTISLPLLRKDFIIDEHQIHEAKANGADAILLIASILEKNNLADLHHAATEIGLECLVELYEEKEIDNIDFDIMKLIGVNNRDLRTFTIDIKHSVKMSKMMPNDITFVSESGIHHPDDIKRLQDADIHAALIGEHLMKSENPGDALRELLSRTHE